MNSYRINMAPEGRERTKSPVQINADYFSMADGWVYFNSGTPSRVIAAYQQSYVVSVEQLGDQA